CPPAQSHRTLSRVLRCRLRNRSGIAAAKLDLQVAAKFTPAGRLSFSATPTSAPSISSPWESVASDCRHRRIGGSTQPALGTDESLKPVCPGQFALPLRH